jgi:hypothetical protein
VGDKVGGELNSWWVVGDVLGKRCNGLWVDLDWDMGEGEVGDAVLGSGLKGMEVLFIEMWVVLVKDKGAIAGWTVGEECNISAG